jgi:hypothetical protein
MAANFRYRQRQLGPKWAVGSGDGATQGTLQGMDSKMQPIVNVVDMEQVRSQLERRPPALRPYSSDAAVLEAVDRISGLLDSPALAIANVSARIPAALREAAALAVTELGAAPSATALTSAALRATLESLVMQAVLDDHYERYPGSRPDLGDLAIAAAELDGHPLATEPDLLHRAADEIVGRHPDASPEDVLLWAEARTYAA